MVECNITLDLTVGVDKDYLVLNSFRQYACQSTIGVLKLRRNPSFSSVLNDANAIDTTRIKNSLLDSIEVLLINFRTSAVAKTWSVDDSKAGVADFDLVLLS